MANSYLNMAATTTAAVLVRRALVRCRLPSTLSAINFLGIDQATQLNELTDLVNDAIGDVLDDCPLLNLVETQLTATAGSESTTLPADLRNGDIMALNWAYVGFEGQAIRLIPRNEIESMARQYVGSGITADPPMQCYLKWGTANAQLGWLPAPAVDREFDLLYRATHTPITLAGVLPEGEATEEIVPVPNAMMDLLIFKLASKIAMCNTGADGIDWQAFDALYDKKLDEWAGKLASTPLAQRLATITFAGLPGTSYNNSMSDLPNRGHYSYFTR